MLRTRIESAIRRYNKHSRNPASKYYRTNHLIGCSIPELRAYLESKWMPGMTRDNHSYRGWHIDHIKPCASFILSDPEQQKRCFHFSNMQPLWALDNMGMPNRRLISQFSGSFPSSSARVDMSNPRNRPGSIAHSSSGGDGALSIIVEATGGADLRNGIGAPRL